MAKMKLSLERLWAVKEARTTLVLVGLMALLLGVWLFSSPAPGDIATAPSTATPAPARATVVKGKLDTLAGHLTPGQPATVHLSVPELAFQAEVAVEPEDGSFAIPLKLDPARQGLHFNLEVRQGERRWSLAHEQILATDQEETVVELFGTPKEVSKPVGRRAHLLGATDQAGSAKKVGSGFPQRRERMMQQAKSRLERRLPR